MPLRYCPRCGSEYRTGFNLCRDCNVALEDRSPASADDPRPSFEMIERVDVFTTGRRIDAEMVRGLLEAHGFDARIFGGGMGAYRLESAVTEITGVPSPFNAYGVGVPAEDADEARALLADVAETADGETLDEETVEEGSDPGLLELMRTRWALVAAALLLLMFVILYGPARP